MAKLMERRYWDACCITALIANEANRAETCRNLLNDAKNGSFLAVTAAHTIVEITRKSNVGLQHDKRPTIDRFFENDYFLIVDVDRAVAEQGRKLAWDLGLRPADAIHVAAAMRAKVRIFYTYDGSILTANGKVPFMRIMRPEWIGQPELPNLSVIPS